MEEFILVKTFASKVDRTFSFSVCFSGRYYEKVLPNMYMRHKAEKKLSEKNAFSPRLFLKGDSLRQSRESSNLTVSIAAEGDNKNKKQFFLTMFFKCLCFAM